MIPLLLDLEVRDIAGPLAQFQAKKVEKAGMFEVIQSLNQLAPHPIPEDRMTQLFDALWPELEKKIVAVPKASAQVKHARPQPEILEELVTSVRTLDSRFREIAEDSPRGFRRRWRRLHPMMVHELSHMLGEKRGDPVSLLILASVFRDDMPWMYELGVEAYRMAKEGTREDAAAARRRFQRAAEIMRKGPFPPEEMGIDPHTVHMILRELDHLIHAEQEPESETEPQPESESAASKPKKRKSGKAE